MTNSVKTIAIVAGEASGDLLGSLLLDAIKQAFPNVRFIGIGGPKMQAQGMEVLFPLEKLSVNGYIEVLRHYRELIGIRRNLRERFIAEPPDLFIGIDAPDFNLDLELALKQHGIPTVHYVSPSIWAWRGERIHKIKQAVSHMLALFPFEAPLYQKAGVQVTYVGHPLADMLPEAPNRSEMREQMRIMPRNAKVFAFLPGSRQGEVRRLARTYIETARLILQKVPEAQFLVPLASRETRTIFENEIWKQEAQQLPITLLFGHAHDAMIAADGALVASGTATLEAALLKCPMVITYKMPALTYWLAKRKQYLPYVGLPNILAGKFVVPEILQDDATPENLSQALLNLVSNKHAVAELEQTFGAIHRTLRQDTAQKAAAAILPFLA
ncbi:lipid-A-disaccharide synthase [Sideroxydans lithotrophicus]|uniref:Lipid-A-disaccharide synthase n=1 Tax=Sideroxydans lithotrophicus (strain ES-1) TaxID=580332 RepID=D5CSD5_SIDLE|nr:lipid-A-disaccharide synthase [Sideroxydans lithotrophicus]ADE11871.1 lipid-A-disaccharide synthase [Sideroxydans lithotrophicus ES-1]